MNKITRILSFLGLALVIGPPVLYLFTVLEKSSMSVMMIVGTVLWFGSVAFWMGRR